MQEIEKIESFYNSKFTEYCAEFEILRDTFIKKKLSHRNRNR